eukprot:3300401-Lingulodinium_polyedra.AAC.1
MQQAPSGVRSRALSVSRAARRVAPEARGEARCWRAQAACAGPAGARARVFAGVVRLARAE